MLSGPLQAAARHRVQARVDDRHTPGLELLFMDLHLVPRQVDRDIRTVKRVMGKKFLYLIK
jgi:hypothetical protein